jgi:hypothetical protein
MDPGLRRDDEKDTASRSGHYYRPNTPITVIPAKTGIHLCSVYLINSCLNALK